MGIGAALLVGVGSWAKDRAYDRYLERRYPVAGEYITKFEDEEDGEREVVTAPATLEQSGRSVRGRTTMVGDDREWVLSGQLSTDGYLNGVYYARDPHDRGIGNFFLYIDHDKNMEGLWSGYDEVNKRISSGKYTFTSTLDAFEVGALDPGSIPAVVDIADRELGKGYLDPDLIGRSTDDDGPYFTRVATVDARFGSDESIADRLAERLLDESPVAAETVPGFDGFDSKVVGFCLGAVFTLPELREYLRIDGDDVPSGVAHAERIGVVRTIAVHDEFESQGIGTRLVGDCVSECLSRGATALCSVGWREDGRVNIGGIMDHFGFQRAGEYEEYWREESVEEGYRCDSCGEPPCTCSAVLFTRYL